MKFTHSLLLAGASLSLLGCIHPDPASLTREPTAANDANTRRMAKQSQANTKATDRRAADYRAPSE